MAEQTMGPEQLLVTWGLYEIGGRMTDPSTPAKGGDPGEDREQLAALYVQTCPGFFKAAPVLRHVYVYHNPPGSFDPRMPGETLTEALRRQEWRFLEGLDIKHVGPTILEEFLRSLTVKCKERPFTYWVKVEETVLPLRTQFA